MAGIAPGAHTVTTAELIPDLHDDPAISVHSRERDMVSFQSLKSEYEADWANLTIRPSRLDEANAAARRAISGKTTYQQIEQRTGVPWTFVALCHYRESDFDFDTYLGNGQSLHRVTTLVPKGRGPFATFADGAVDALRIQDFVGASDWGIARMLFRLEAFNGFGYHAKSVNSPYLYGGSTLYGPPDARAGKYVRDHVFDPSFVDTQLGTAVVLRAMMTLDPSITIDASPPAGGNPEPDDEMASTVLLMQQALNRLGASPPLAEDGISGPKTKAAVSRFQQQNGLNDSGLLDGATIAAITRAGQQIPSVVPATPQVDLTQILKRLEDLTQLIPLQNGTTAPSGTTSATNDPISAITKAGQQITTLVPAGDLSTILKRLEDLTQLIAPQNGNGTTAANGTTLVPNDPISLFERLFSLVNSKTAAMPGTATPTNPAPVDQLKQVVDVLGALLTDAKPVLGQVNGALGETLGKLLDGKKTALGIGGSLLTALLSAVTASPGAGGIAGLFGTIASAVPGLSQFALPVFLAVTAWGVLGKLEKWAQGTAPPPKAVA
jgi:lysozyme family protein/peptidoglycan hydrolase-like protein with peptidoglycan-binding domain